MGLSTSRCALGVHRYVYGGVLLGQRLERCERCGKIRAGRLTGAERHELVPAGRVADRDLVAVEG